MMKLHDNWVHLLTRAWSIRFMILAAIFSGFGTFLTIAQPYLGINPVVVAAIAGFAAFGAALAGIYSRLVVQKNLGANSGA